MSKPRYRVVVTDKGRPISVHDCTDLVHAQSVKEHLRGTVLLPSVIQMRVGSLWVDAEERR